MIHARFFNRTFLALGFSLVLIAATCLAPHVSFAGRNGCIGCVIDNGELPITPIDTLEANVAAYGGSGLGLVGDSKTINFGTDVVLESGLQSYMYNPNGDCPITANSSVGVRASWSGDSCQAAGNGVSQCNFGVPPSPGTYYLYFYASNSYYNACGGPGSSAGIGHMTLTIKQTCDPAIGSSCTSDANDCGQTRNGSITGSCTCSAATPPNPNGYGQSCQSGANSCGDRNSGSRQCNGSCDASAPGERSQWNNYCRSSETNDCGMYGQGRTDCDGICQNASVPGNASCDPPGLSLSGTSGGVGSGNATTMVVQKGSTATLSWDAGSLASTCTVQGYGVDACYGTSCSPIQPRSSSGSITTPPVTGTVFYTVTCWAQSQKYGVGPKTAKTFRIIPNPAFREI